MEEGEGEERRHGELRSNQKLRSLEVQELVMMRGYWKEKGYMIRCRKGQVINYRQVSAQKGNKGKGGNGGRRKGGKGGKKIVCDINKQNIASQNERVR